MKTLWAKHVEQIQKFKITFSEKNHLSENPMEVYRHIALCVP